LYDSYSLTYYSVVVSGVCCVCVCVWPCHSLVTRRYWPGACYTPTNSSSNSSSIDLLACSLRDWWH